MNGIDWQAVAATTLHPLQMRVLEHAAGAPEQRFAPVDLAREFDVPLASISYHVRTLAGHGLLRKAGTAPRRGAVQHYYRAADRLLR